MKIGIAIRTKQFISFGERKRQHLPVYTRPFKLIDKIYSFSETMSSKAMNWPINSKYGSQPVIVGTVLFRVVQSTNFGRYFLFIAPVKP
jgi:hypothetical protein